MPSFYRITEDRQFNMNRGQCRTFRYTKRLFSQDTDMAVFGFMFRARYNHSISTMDETLKNKVNDTALIYTQVVRQDGWIVFVHDTREKWSGRKFQNSDIGRILF